MLGSARQFQVSACSQQATAILFQILAFSQQATAILFQVSACGQQATAILFQVSACGQHGNCFTVSSISLHSAGKCYTVSSISLQSALCQIHRQTTSEEMSKVSTKMTLPSVQIILTNHHRFSLTISLLYLMRILNVLG